MKMKPFSLIPANGPRMSQALRRFGRWCLLFFLLGTNPGRAAEFQVIRVQSTRVTTNMMPLREYAPWGRLNLSLSLPWRNQETLTNLLQQLYDPASTNYHRFLTPAQFAERFGPTAQDYEAVADFAKKHGLAIVTKHSNRALLKVRGTVSDIEQAFHVRLNEYQHPAESRTFFAPDRDPAVDLAVPLLSVAGLDNYVVPHKCLQAVKSGQAAPNLTGSAPGGAYLGNDFRAAYVPGLPQTGTGQKVALLEFDSGYYQSDINAYENLAGLPAVPISAVLLDGYGGAAGGGNDEVSLDIEMAISMAPGLQGILVYEGSVPDDILNRIAEDDQAKTIGASWTYPTDAGSEQAFLQMAAQGQSFFNASGDSDAYPSGEVPTPADDPNITVVGGTTLTTTGPAGAWVSEKVWNWGDGFGSSGGISTQVPIPAWQQGIDMSASQGSTTMRNLPDVAMTADNVYVIYGNGRAGTFGGTSCATPLWAGFIALVNQLALTNGEPTVGFINPAIYGMGKGSNSLSYTSLFRDITTGNNESASSPSRFLAVPGYDLCTGWGTPSGSSLVTALALPEPLRITLGGDGIVSEPAGGPLTTATLTYVLTNNGSSPLNWTVNNTSVWFNVVPNGGALVRGGPSTSVAASGAATDTNLAPGGYSATLVFSNLSDGFVQFREVTLDVVTPPVITSQPANQALLIGMTANFNVSNATNALMFYQWQKNGTNLFDGGMVSGSATSGLAIADVTSNDFGTYSVILSNAAGVMVSSNAALTIVPSPPVIVLQPTNQTVLPGTPASFSVAAVGNTPYLYRWQLNGTNISNGINFSGVSSSTLVVSNASTFNSGTYSVLVSNTLGATASAGAVLSLIPVTTPGTVLSTLWSFTDGNSGEFPYSPLALGLDNNFYGTTIEGGSLGDGAIFKLTTNGVLTTIHSFTGNDGAIPYAGLYRAKDDYFYGTTFTAGTYGDGTTFRMTATGVISLLTTFNGINGSLPVAGMIQGTDGNFYGTTLEGGDYGYGTVYRLSTSGALTTLLSFDNNDGAYPSPVLAQGSDGNYYGTTESGGTNGLGTVFKMTPAGALTILHSFSGTPDGASPIPGLIQGVDGNFYGTTYDGGSSGYGTIFGITPSGGLTTLYSFTGANDGAEPWGGLVQARDGNLYGTTQSGGTYGFGTVFQIAPTGPMQTIAQFDGYQGANPSAAMIQGSDGNLYGTTENGGFAGDGAVFRVAIGGPLQITGQPADQQAYIGGTAVFTVATSGGFPVFYQWQQDGVDLTNGGNITGATNATLIVSNVEPGDAAVYTVVASNAFNSVTSDYAVLGVIYSPPDITTQPAGVIRVTGTTATFSVGATGDQPLTYQWQESGTNLADGGNISGSATSTLTISGVTVGNSGNYSVIVSNWLYSVSSAKAALTVVPATTPSTALTQLHNFSGGGDGGLAFGGLIQGKDANLYGTTEVGGSQEAGTAFRMTPSSGGLSILLYFGGGYSGANPYGRLVQGTNGFFYGTTSSGGTNDYGTLFRMTSGGSASYLYSFTGGEDGESPLSGLTEGPDGNFYGVCYQGGANSLGSIYKMSPTGTVTPIYQFTGATDGAYPYGDLVLGGDGNLYGTTLEAGADAFGTVFRVTTNGALSTVVSFNESNGAYPEAGLMQANDGNFYGTTLEGGTNGYGTVFRLTTNGEITTLYSFGNTNGNGPAADLLQGSDGNLYGTCSSGGPGGQGSVFQITTNGTLTTLIWFDGLNGAGPQSALVQANNGEFYGTTPYGGNGFNATAGGGNGTIFQFIVPIFTKSQFTVSPTAISSLPYSASLAGKAVAPAGDLLTYGKVSGPAWLNVAANGLLGGTPTNSDIGTNVFVVSLVDTNGRYASATLSIVVAPDPPPTFFNNPFGEPWANVDEDYSASLATNATAPFLNLGDSITFAKVSGPPWLNVAADGTLSGTPYASYAGTNVFVISATDLGGASNTATLAIFVSAPPFFSPQTFSQPFATVGIPYAGTIAANAVDPDQGAGDALTFYKVTGAGWLDVAAAGALSGTPTGSDVGAENFLVLAVNSADQSALGILTIPVNPYYPPAFLSNPFGELSASAGQPYTATITTNASNPNAGVQLTFSKLGGPAWLTVGPDGALSGLPFSTNGGLNSFVVGLSDPSGFSTNATMLINVTTVPLIMMITQNGTNVSLGWSGGVPPYQLQTNLIPALSGWQNLGGPTTQTNLQLPTATPGLFYRVESQ